MVAVSNTAPKGITDIGDYNWRVSLTEAQVIPAALKIVKGKLGFKTAALLYGNDDVFTKAGFDVMKAALEAEGVKILDIQTFATKDRDFNAQLTALKAKNPEFLMVSALVEQAAGIVAQAKIGFKNAAILYGNDDVFTKGGFDVMKAALEAAGVPIVEIQTFATKDRDFNAQLTALKAKNPEFLMVSALVEQAAAIVSQARQLGWNVPVMGGNGFNSPKFMANAGPAAEGVMVGTAWNKASADPVNVAFIAGQKARGNDPDQFCAQAYTGVLVIADAIAQAGMKGGRDDIKAGFAKVKDLPTPLGKFSFLPSRDGNHPAAVQIVKNGKFEILQ